MQEDFGIEMSKSLESEVQIMCNLSRGVEEKGIEKATLQAIDKNIKNGSNQI